MVRRVLDDELDDLFTQVPAVAIDGPKGVGKTTTAEQHVEGLLRLDSRAAREAIEAEPEQLLRRHRPLLIDEWQKVPLRASAGRRGLRRTSADPQRGHLRTRNGDHEVDLVLVRDDGRVVAVEVKLSGTVSDHDTKHLRWLADRLGDRLLDAIVVTTGPQAYRRPDGIGVVPLGLLGP